MISPLLIPLAYGNEYTSSVLPFLVLLPGMALLTIYNVLSRYFMAIGRQNVNIAIQTFSAVLNVALNFWLIPMHGILGAAIASLVSYSVEAVLVTIAFLRATNKRIASVLLLRRADFTVYRRRLAPVLHRLGFPR